MNRWLGTLVVFAAASAGALGGEPPGGALAGQRPRVVVSSDIGGSDPDDFQSMVHLLFYADVLDIEGLVASPPGKGRAEHILEVLAAYETDYPNLARHSACYPTPDALRAVTKQGAVQAAPEDGVSEATEGSRWIIERAQAKDPQGRPLWVLVWGSITDVAQAVHDAPAIKKAIRIYSIGSWNTAQDRAARDYLFREHPDLWWIESDGTFRGMYQGGQQDGDLGNRSFIEQHVKGHGALGDFYVQKKADLKMGDTPSVLYLFRGLPDDPTAGHWGGAFVRPEPDKRPTYWHDNPDPAMAEQKPGSKTVSKWRADYLRDWQQRMDRALAPAKEMRFGRSTEGAHEGPDGRGVRFERVPVAPTLGQDRPSERLLLLRTGTCRAHPAARACRARGLTLRGRVWTARRGGGCFRACSSRSLPQCGRRRFPFLRPGLSTKPEPGIPAGSANRPLPEWQWRRPGTCPAA